VIHRVGAGDPRIAPYAHVGDHAWLTGRRLFVAEGRLVLERLIGAGTFEIQSVLVTPAALEALGNLLEHLSSDVYVAPQAALNEVTGFNFHRGCLALVRRPERQALEDLLHRRRLLVLEQVGNPDNVGGLFRTAAALGAGGVVLDPRTADPWYRKAIRTSMGAVLRVPFTRVDDWPDGLSRLRERGIRLIALTPHGAARTLPQAGTELGPESRVAFLLGAEGAGLSAGALAAADDHVRIPIAQGVDSLNVVVAAAIALYAFGGGSP
jgi:tRNA G18 (ribose-2'-O)-methylase SpoU